MWGIANDWVTERFGPRQPSCVWQAGSGHNVQSGQCKLPNAATGATSTALTGRHPEMGLWWQIGGRCGTSPGGPGMVVSPSTATAVDDHAGTVGGPGEPWPERGPPEGAPIGVEMGARRTQADRKPKDARMRVHRLSAPTPTHPGPR